MQSLPKWTALAAAIALSVTSFPGAAAPGDFDTSFGTGGYVMTTVQSTGGADGVAIDTHQRIVVAGSSTDLALARMAPTLLRYLPDGTLDTSFGDAHNGTAFLTPAAGVGDTADFCCVRLDSKNRIIAAGLTQFASPTGLQQVLTVARFSEDGILDPSFGSNGIVANIIGAGEMSSQAQSIAIDGSDRVLVGGVTFDYTYTATPVILRYDIDGALDHTFASGGILTIPETGYIPAPVGITIDTHGRIGAAGNYASGSYVVRYLDDGSVDAAFGSDGSGLVEIDGVPADAFAIDAADRPLLASALIDGWQPGVMRLTADGTPDASFGPDGDGVVVTSTGDILIPHAMAIDLAGNVIVATVEEDAYSNPLDIAVLRYTGDGLPDTSFGTDGIATLGISGYPVAHAVVIDAANAITVAGYAADENSEYQFTTARLQN